MAAAQYGKVIIEYCASWGYKNAFLRVARTIQANYPDIEIEGSILSPGPGKEFIAQICSLIFMFGLLTMLLGEWFGSNLNIPKLSSLARTMKENQMQSIMFIFLCNYVGGQMLETGAFEIHYEDQLIFSKIQSGGLPQMDQLMDLVGHAVTNYRFG